MDFRKGDSVFFYNNGFAMLGEIVAVPSETKLDDAFQVEFAVDREKKPVLVCAESLYKCPQEVDRLVSMMRFHVRMIESGIEKILTDVARESRAATDVEGSGPGKPAKGNSVK